VWWILWNMVQLSSYLLVEIKVPDRVKPHVDFLPEPFEAVCRVKLQQADLNQSSFKRDCDNWTGSMVSAETEVDENTRVARCILIQCCHKIRGTSFFQPQTRVILQKPLIWNNLTWLPKTGSEIAGDFQSLQVNIEMYISCQTRLHVQNYAD
jgi:hypothetical protein